MLTYNIVGGVQVVSNAQGVKPMDKCVGKIVYKGGYSNTLNVLHPSSRLAIWITMPLMLQLSSPLLKWITLI